MFANQNDHSIHMHDAEKIIFQIITSNNTCGYLVDLIYAWKWAHKISKDTKKKVLHPFCNIWLLGQAQIWTDFVVLNKKHTLIYDGSRKSETNMNNTIRLLCTVYSTMTSYFHCHLSSDWIWWLQKHFELAT